MRYEEMSLKEAYGLVKGKRSSVHPNRGFRQQLLDYEMELRGENTVAMETFGDEKGGVRYFSRNVFSYFLIQRLSECVRGSGGEWG